MAMGEYMWWIEYNLRHLIMFVYNKNLGPDATCLWRMGRRRRRLEPHEAAILMIGSPVRHRVALEQRVERVEWGPRAFVPILGNDYRCVAYSLAMVGRPASDRTVS